MFIVPQESRFRFATRGRAAMAAFGLIGVVACAGEASAPCGGAGQICTVAGIGEQAFNGDGRPADETAFYLPTAAREAPDGTLLVMDFNNMRLRHVREDGRVETLAGTGEHLGAQVGVDARESPLENPIDFHVGPDGDIVIVSLHDARVLRVASDGRMQAIAGTGDTIDAGDGGPALQASFVELRGVVVGGDGSVYVSDGGAYRVRVIRPSGVIETLAGGGVPGYTGDGGPANVALLIRPEGLSVDDDGSLYIADSGAHVIRRVDPEGMIETVAGTGRGGFTGDGELAVAAELRSPEGVHARAGELFISDTRNHRVRRVDARGVITTLAGTGNPGYTGDGGPAAEADLYGPSRLWASDDRLLIPDTSNGVVRAVDIDR